MATTVGDLLVRIGADTSDFQSKISNTISKLSSLSSATEQSSQTFDKMAGAINRATSGVLSFQTQRFITGENLALLAKGAAGFAAVGTAITSLVKVSGDWAESIVHASSQTGISATTLQGYGLALQDANLSTQDLVIATRALSRAQVEARTGTGDSYEVFRNLVGETNALKLASSDMDTILRTVADEFVGMADGADKTRIAAQLFGRSGMQLIPLLNQGSAALDKIKADMASLGAVVSEQGIKALNEADFAFDRLVVAVQGTGHQLAAFAAGSVTATTNALTSLVGWTNRAIAGINSVGDTMTAKRGQFAQWVVDALGIAKPADAKAPRDLGDRYKSLTREEQRKSESDYQERYKADMEKFLADVEAAEKADYTERGNAANDYHQRSLSDIDASLKKKMDAYGAYYKALADGAQRAKLALTSIEREEFSEKVGESGNTLDDKLRLLRNRAFMATGTPAERQDELQNVLNIAKGLRGGAASDDVERLVKVIRDDLRTAIDQQKTDTEAAALVMRKMMTESTVSAGELDQALKLVASDSTIAFEMTGLADAIAAVEELQRKVSSLNTSLSSVNSGSSVSFGDDGAEISAHASGSGSTREGLAYLHAREAVIPAALNFLQPGLSRAERTARLMQVAGGVPSFASGTASFDPSFGVSDLFTPTLLHAWMGKDVAIGRQEHLGMTIEEFQMRQLQRANELITSGAQFGTTLGQSNFALQGPMEEARRLAFDQQQRQRAFEEKVAGMRNGAGGTDGINITINIAGTGLSSATAIRDAVRQQVVPMLQQLILDRRAAVL